MRTLLILPPTTSVVKEVLGSAGPPLGLAYLASVARMRGWKPMIIDGLAENLTPDALEEKIRKFKPDVVGLTATTPAIYDAYEAARIAKELNPETLVIIGGPHATFTAEEVLTECRHVDLVVMGEGEQTFGEILERYERGGGFADVLGVAYRSEDGVVKVNPPRPLIRNLDDVPIPAYDLLPMDRYEVNGVSYAAIMTSRGCPYNCVFCSSSLQ
ncbi:MAG TPA: B12-binding domain-containing radical SAM protein, partial [Nitrososphaeria archaeon]|nr:B12-binding domain-containing radical SAM protein [Nitrososphaeria archaeon]